MKPALLGIIVLGTLIILVPEEKEIFRALRRSTPRPELERLLLEKLNASPHKLPLFREIARIRRERGDLSGELAIRERWRKLSRDRENLQELLRLHLWENHNQEAYAIARELLEGTPENRELRELALELAEFTGRLREAREDALWLLQRGSRDPRIARVFLAAKDAEGLSWVLSHPRERARALVAIEAQPEAIEAYREHLLLEPRDFDSHRELAQLYRWNHRILDAAGELEECLAIRADEPIRLEVIELYRAAGRIDLMLKHLPEGLERADVLLALGRIEEAKTSYEKLGRLDKLLDLSVGMPTSEDEISVRERLPMTPENRRRLAALYVWRKEFRKAIPHYEAVGDERLIDMYLALGDADAAIQAAKKLGLHRRLGSLYLWLGELENAITELEKVPEEGVELTRLYIRVGRRHDALRLLDKLSIDPYLRLELLAYAGQGEAAAQVGRSIPDEDWDPDRVEHVARAADAGTSIELYRLLLERSGSDERFALALARIYEQIGRPQQAAGYLRMLLERHPDDRELLARLGLLVSDRALLERALASGSRDPRVFRRLADMARTERRNDDAIRLYREYHRLKDDDAESHFALGELTRDMREFDRAWDLLPPGEHRLRARILWHRGDLAGAERLFREVEDYVGLVDLLLDMKRYEEAAKLPMTPRQQAVLALGQGRYEDAVRLLRTLDLGDPDIRLALAQSLYALGHWQEAEEYATGELKKEIHGTYGPEASAAFAVRESQQQEVGSAAARYRMYLAEPFFIRVEGRDYFAKGTVPSLARDFSENFEGGDVSVYYSPTPRFYLGAGGGDWHNPRKETGDGFAEVVARHETWGIAARGRFDEPWVDSLGSMVRSGIENVIEGGLSLTPAPWLIFLGGVEERWYQAPEDPSQGFVAESATETKARARLDIRFWTGEGTVGRYFYDTQLLNDATIQSHLGFGVEYDYSDLRGPAALLNVVGLSPRSELLTVGPSAALAGSGAGIFVRAFVGTDPARSLPIGKVWGGTGGVVLTCWDRWKLGAIVEYINEQPLIVGGPSWAANVGLNYNF